VVEIYDDWVHNNQDYRWDLLEGYDTSNTSINEEENK